MSDSSDVSYEEQEENKAAITEKNLKSKIKRLETKAVEQTAKEKRLKRKVELLEAQATEQDTKHKRLKRKVEQMETKVTDQESKIIELGIQALQNRFDIIHLQHIITRIHPDPEIKAELDRGVLPALIGMQEPRSRAS